MVYTWIKSGTSKYQMIANGGIYATVLKGGEHWSVYVRGELVQRTRTLKTAREFAQGMLSAYVTTAAREVFDV